MKKIQYMLLVAGLWMVGTMSVMAQVPAANIRYVKTEENGGKYTNDGKSWATAKNNIQDAINALVAAKALPGEVWVGAGTYKPTESTESSGGSTLYMSFKIPAGITVRGGFPADGKIKKMSGAQIGQDSIDAYITSPDQRPMIDYTEVGAFAFCQTILTGDLSSQPATFKYNDSRDQFTTTFYGNSYHVVTFATNGFHADGHAKALDTSKGEAAIECMIIEHGNAQFPATEGHPHEAYGGGIYMVKGSHVYNTCVRQCEATRAGGGIYMDGGGIADHVYVSECQALGIGTTYGYGGGICMEDGTYEASDATKGMYPTVLRRSGVTGSVARNGGGLAIYCNNPLYKNRLACSAVLVSNNVAQNEAGGVYCYQGGALSQMTITRNKCIGSGIAVNGMVNGRSGGLYVRDFGNIANSVIWGNECGNRNVQYAGSRSGNEETKKPIMRCVMLSRADYADWSGVIKYQVNDLSELNKPAGRAASSANHTNYPAFKSPTPDAGYISDIYYRSLMALDNEHPAYSWKVEYSSALANAGVQTIDLDTAGVTPAMNESRDIIGEVFSSHPTLGGYTSTIPVAKPEYGADGTMHLYVNPDAHYTDQSANIGDSWDNAAHSMSDILNLMQRTLDALKIAYEAYQAGTTKNPFENDDYTLNKIQVHVKEGKVTNNGAYSVGHVRNNTLLIPSIPAEIVGRVTIEILGGYAPSLTGRDLSVRNPMKYPTIITGDIIDDYAYNVSHLVTFNGAKNVTFDGFQLRNGNASSTMQDNTNLNGAAFTILNSTGVTIKNCLVAGCSAEIGAAVYADNSSVGFENCIFHNNASTQQIGLGSSKPGIVYSAGTGTLTFDHCDVLRNVGYASWLDGTATQTWTNTLFYGNLNAPVDDTNDTESDNSHYVMATPAFGGTVANASGSYCLFDGKSAAFTQFTNSRFDMSYVFDGGANSNYPRMINPTKNAGVSPNGDVTYYGRATSFEPHNTNPMVNAASTNGVAHTSASSSDCWGKDMSAVINRDYGGLPDIGAIENHYAEKAVEGENAYADGQGFYGRTLYVRDYGNLTDGGDGSSWKNAINGNAYYHEASGIFMGATKNGSITWTEIAKETTTNYGSPATTYEASTEQDPKLFLISSQTANKYLKVAANGTFSLVTSPADASEFIITAQGAIYDYNNHVYVSLSKKSQTSGNGKNKTTTWSASFVTSNTPLNWNINTNQGRIYTTDGGQSFIWSVKDASATTPSLSWKDWTNPDWCFTSVEHIIAGTPTTHTQSVVGIEGLQYAVNKAAILNEDDNIRREVWVAAGTYEKDNETITTDRHFPLDYTNWDESCFIIRDGVDVFGAFPKAGNPGKDQRQALVSTHVISEAGYSPADYETVLQPKTKTQTAGTRHRVLGQPYKCNKKAAGYYDYKGATWDGFTLQNGFLDANGLDYVSRNGGGGAAVYYNVTLRNVVVANNKVVYYNAGSQQDFRAAGIYMDGGTLEAGYVINNTLEAWDNNSVKSKSSGAAYGGGMYIYKGTVFNSVVSHNLIYANYADGAGIFIENADFFNNTIVNNYADGSARKCGGVAIWTSGAGSVLNVYNSIILNNTGAGGGIGTGPNLRVPNKGVMNIHNSIVDKMTNTGSGDKAIYFMDCATATMDNTLFATPGSYYDNFKGLNMRLAKGSVAINKGDVNPVLNGQVYDLSTYTDMDYTERVKDCSIDVGAYEYNDAYAIAPDEATVSGQAIFYVTPLGNGVASATDPANAACAEKLQKVLDAAGRYKFQNPGKQVIVKVAKETDKDIDSRADYSAPTWGGTNDEITTIANYRQYLSGLTLMAGSSSLLAETGLTAPANATATFKLFDNEPVKVNAGSELTIILTLPLLNTSDSLKGVVANVWMDTNGDKNFDRQLALVGTPSENNYLDTVKVIIPSTARNGATRLRIRLDSSWKIAQNAADQNNRMVYDIPIEIVGSTNNNFFSYYATRSTDPSDQDVRIWSIMVPRGVEVWGGYSDVPMKMVDGKVVADTEHSWSNTYNGFYTPAAGGDPAVDLRDIIGNPTHFDATYTNKLERTTATAYHIVTFTDRIFDGNGNPYLATDDDLTHDSHYNPDLAYENEADYKHMSDNTLITDRAVLDGIFLTGGRADAPSSAESKLLSIHQFGGAAVVEPYAHVRNCIVEDNSATYGGALALKEKALVSGCLIRNNTATNQGAGIYVFEDGTELSESGRVGRYTVHTAKGDAAKADANMSRVILSTIVRNQAKQGGGIWFSNSDANMRVNSSVLWQNTANDQPNVSGAYSPDKPASDQTSTIEFYPFAYSAVQGLRLSGTNNIQLEPLNKNGARFALYEDINTMALDEENYTDFGYYGLTSLSAMVRTGMSLSEFDDMRTNYGLSATDFMSLDRKVNDPNAPARTYIEIGARAIDKPFQNKQLMLRLFVAQPEDVDADAAQAMASMAVGAAQGSAREYYSQQGSSFAYPFQSLQDALDYIYLMRSTKVHTGSQTYIDAYHANNLPFEIMIAKGTYYPTRDLSGNYGESLANTFAIPEGVSLYGGFSISAGEGQWYGRYMTPKAYSSFIEAPTTPGVYNYTTENVEANLSADVTLSVDDKNYRILQTSAIEMAAGRAQTDVNKNNIIEPWEFKNQTILSGNATSAADQGVYHIVTICPDETVVGILPTISGYRDDASYTAAGGYRPKEYGQYIQFNGLTFQGGRAHSYSAELDEMAKYNYYHGGALLIDGNRYNNNYNDSVAANQGGSWEHKATDYKHTGRTNAVAYRDIMTTIANCRFYDNEAGYGGAISTNAELELFNSAFENNLASYFSDRVTNGTGVGPTEINVSYAGQGGAVFSTYSLSAFNTLFANNEARDLNHTGLTSGTYYSYRNYNSGGSNELPGTGGAVYGGLHSTTHMFNCDVVRNMANSYPGVFTMNPNTYNGDTLVTSAAAYNQIVNTVFWGNEVNATVKSANSDSGKLFAAQLAINYGAANRDIAASYDPFASDKYPTSQADLDDAANDNSLAEKKFSEMLYFCAYEEGRGITAKNSNDFRQVSPHFYVHPTYTFSHVPNDPHNPTGLLPYQNNNIAISGDNDALDGPAFMRPSYSAGIAGYLEAADWSPARLNNLTDNGSGKLMQTISDVVVDDVPKKVASFIKYTNAGELPSRSIYGTPDPEYPAFTTEKVGDFKGDGAYTLARYLANYPYYKDYLAIGDEHYMRTSTGNEMHRISLDPNPTHDQTYVDIGVYEYIHVELEPETEDEVDILWVSNFEKPENGTPNGESWLRPTSDLQRAIETLLASRNGHRKEIRICDGTYAPIYTIDGNLSFYIDTKYLNTAATGTDGKGVKSLTIKGGYSREYNNQYDVDLYPAIIKQQTTSTASPKYDHLIYIKDATQRYHGAYNESTQYGWNVSTHDNKVNTFPIQIDGVTLINDQATELASGAAIYYACQSSDGHPVSLTTDAYVTTGKDGSGNHTGTPKSNPAKLIISKTTVLGSGAKNHTSGATAVWSCADGGSVLIYNSLFHSNFGSPLCAFNALTINNTYALNGGSIYLGATGGQSKMFNSVLWKNNNNGYQLEMDGLSHDTGNTGDYIHTSKADIFAYNAYTGGNTADIDYDPTTGTGIRDNNHNVGLVNLNTDVTYGPNFHDPENADVLKRDFHISPSMRLLNKGDNTLYGDTALATNDGVYDLAWEVTKRYDRASQNRIAAATIDLGAYEYQYDLNRVLYVDPNKATSGDGLSWEQALGFGNIQNAIDLAGVAHSNLKKSTYVFVKAASSTNMDLHTGETLTLRDGVQVYGSVMADYGVECPYKKADENSEREFDDEILDAYVSDVLLYGRYGTISPVEGHTRISGINTNGTAFTTTDGSKTLHRTLIDGFEVMPKDAAAATITAPVVNITPYQADNVLATGNVKVGLRNIAVHGYNATGSNVAYVDNAILYSTLFHHNTVSGGNAVMELGQYGYLLNATIEGKTIGADGQVALHGGATAQDGKAWQNVAGEATSHIFCSLVNFNYPGYRHEATIRTLSGYCYALEDENLNYQLTEYSPNIDNYIGVVPTGIATQLQDYASALTPAYTATEATNINDLIAHSYLAGEIGSAKLTVSEGKLKAADRDLLGNFRWQPEFRERADDDVRIIDRGAFETWKIEKPYFVVYPNYPYPGTCEYIMKDQALMIDPVDVAGDATASAHIPGFVLLQEGASLYGNGREMEIAYVALERTVKNGQDLMFSLPWDQNMVYNGITNPDRNAVNGLFVVEYENNALKTVRTDAGPVYTYDPTARADWQYRIAPQDSKCWKEITSPVLPACTGAYTQIAASNAAGVKDDPNAEMTIRCQGKGMSMHDYIYEELVEEGHLQHTGKTVKLYPHDDITSTAGGGDFTDAKNAGWNFIGYPYLITHYHPYTKAIITPEDDVNAELNPGVNDQYKDNVLITETYSSFLASPNPYAMDRPQTMWLWYDGVKRPDGTDVDGTGGFYSVNSWLREPSAWHVADDVEPVLRVTEGFFVQTHTLQDHEDLVFYRPTYRSHYGDPASAPERVAYSPYRYYVGDENENENEKPGVVSPDKVDSLLRNYEKIVRNDHVYIVRRDAEGRIHEAYDLTGRAVKL